MKDSRRTGPLPSRIALTAAAPALVFLLLGGPGTAAGQGQASANVTAAARKPLSGKPFPVTFVDVARQAGLGMEFASGRADRKKYIVEANGTGVAFLNYDNDGWLDIFLVNQSYLEGFPDSQAPTHRLYRNTGDGKFTDATEEANVAHPGWGSGVCAGDYDNDGAADLFVTHWGPNVLFHNTGDGKFADVTSRAGDLAGNPKERRFCGLPTRPGSPYCENHHRLCYKPAAPKAVIAARTKRLTGVINRRESVPREDSILVSE